MPLALKPFYRKELTEAASAYSKGYLQQSWLHLERAHILGQPYPLAHSYVHWKMFLFGIKTKNLKEIIGQIPRLLVGGVKSFVGNIPIGNTGGANVPALQPMEIPEELKLIIENANGSKKMKNIFISILMVCAINGFGQSDTLRQSEYYFEFKAVKKSLFEKGYGFNISINFGQKYLSEDSVIKIETINKIESFSKIEDVLSFLNERGWKLVTAYTTSHDHFYTFYYLLKREL